MAKTVKDIIFKVATGLLLLLFGIGFFGSYDFNDLNMYGVFSYLAFILIVLFYIAIIAHIVYINKYKSDKFYILPLSLIAAIILLYIIINIIVAFSRVYGIDPIVHRNRYLIMASIYLLLLIGHIFTILHIINNYKYKVFNYIVATLMLIIIILGYTYEEPLLEAFCFIGIIINLLYFTLSKKGPDDFVQADKAYDIVIKAKRSLDENLITNEEYEKIRTKYVKFL